MVNRDSQPTPTAKRGVKRIVVSRLQHGWLNAMGVDVPWIAANEPAASAAAVSPSQPQPEFQQASVHQSPAALNPVVAPPAVTKPAIAVDQLSELDVSAFDLLQIAQAVGACQRCGLCETRRNTVPGDGVQNPTILIVGEAPGEQEDQDGKPFVGRSGQLLDNMLQAIGHGRDTSVFITNVVKCRPPANRNPRDEEITACAPYLARQIELLAPTVILAMGRFAAHALLKTEAPLQKLRESTHMLEIAGQSMPVVVTYHPAYLLRRPVDKRLAWEDLKRVRALAC